MDVHIGGSIGYLDEAIFKPFLADYSNTIIFLRDKFGGVKSYIDCLECKNYWLVKEEKDYQISNLYCKHDKNLRMFNEEIKNKLKLKCK